MSIHSIESKAKNAIVMLNIDVLSGLMLPSWCPVVEGIKLEKELARIIGEELNAAKARVQERFDVLIQTSKWTGSDGDQNPPSEFHASPKAGRRSSE